MTKEGVLSKLIELQVRKIKGLRLFRNNVGGAWQPTGKPIHKNENGAHYVILRNPRFVEYGLHPGSSDYIGWREVVITPDMVGQTVAIFVAIEAKEEIKGVASKDQLNFLTVIRKAGGIAGLARTPDELHRICGD